MAEANIVWDCRKLKTHEAFGNVKKKKKKRNAMPGVAATRGPEDKILLNGAKQDQHEECARLAACF